ncbi:MAG: hypothetical protein H0W03_04775 [Solirubrobacterales bacterium]|nr:hypothetical protein [Solirubrobacterales bacterium]
MLDSVARLRLRIGQVGAQERLTAEEEVRTPPAGDMVRAKALEAAAALASRAGKLPDLAADAQAAINGAVPALRLAALKLCIKHPELPTQDLHALLDDGDADVVAVALAALDEADQLAFDDPALLAARTSPTIRSPTSALTAPTDHEPQLPHRATRPRAPAG